MSLVRLVSDCTRLYRSTPFLAPIHVGIMKGTPYTNARRAQRRDAREQRVHTGIPSVRHDWRCPICRKWYSTYRKRDRIHYKHCKNNAVARIAREEERRAQKPLPSPDYFTPRSTPDQPSTRLPVPSTPGSPAREPSLAPGHAQQQDQLSENNDVSDVEVPQHLEDSGKPDIAFQWLNRIGTHTKYHIRSG